ncbi:uncharacterized protein LOC9661590 [Selaginella moellendorffii]|uniref:uncharacterized protein LOC9661590 n=1 Tax=Selaginella moellendorffii TaxID=88036 RepID=UPI000D1C5621|nr:uncharacterized protein LOC9661590 [Selaginella moellendorffii]XP_024519646.1 uncharacterized protein LOC9661590 [Selaginella moellendorffii]|eukprot:XP_024519640.1 uncharacterized protein LOC9661590 [Selaginella moellendorffii]
MALLRRGSRGLGPPAAWWRLRAAMATAAAPAPEQASLEDAFGYKIKPCSLALPPDSMIRYVEPHPGGFRGLMLKVLGFYSKESTRIRGAKRLYARITSQVENPELYSSFGLEKKFRTVHAMLLLHVWMVLVRLRTEEKGENIGQTMYEVFNLDLEQRIYKEGVKMTMIITKWLKELEKNFYGASVAYDKALSGSSMKEDLERALWRNVFAEDDSPMPKSGPQLANVQAFARYVRRELACLVITESEDFRTGNIRFSTEFEALKEDH